MDCLIRLHSRAVPFLFRKKPAVAAVGPWVIVPGKLSAALDGGVAVGPELDKCVRVGVVEPGFAQMVEG